jgi:hypothetical protein
MINRNEAFELLNSNLKNPNLIKHSQAVALVMEALAERFSEDKDTWFITGLLHDIDYDLTFDKPEQHGVLAQEILKDTDISPLMKKAILSHSGNSELSDLLDKALWCADPVTGLVIASALMNPEKSISALQLKSLVKKYKNKAFAAGANREQIASCQNIGLELEDFLEIARISMQALILV